MSGPGSNTLLTKTRQQRELYTLGELNHIRYDKSFDFFKWSLFGQISKNFFLERLAVSVGVRVDGNSYTSGMNNPFKQASPRLSLSYSLSPNGLSMQMPDAIINFPRTPRWDMPTSKETLVNKQNGLKYIRTNHYVVGLEYRPGSRTKITLEGFYKTYDHYPVSLLDSIVLANKGTDYVAVGDEPVKSLGEGRAYGVELMVRTQEFFRDRDIARLHVLLFRVQENGS